MGFSFSLLSLIIFFLSCLFFSLLLGFFFFSHTLCLLFFFFSEGMDYNKRFAIFFNFFSHLRAGVVRSYDLGLVKPKGKNQRRVVGALNNYYYSLSRERCCLEIIKSS